MVPSGFLLVVVSYPSECLLAGIEWLICETVIEGVEGLSLESSLHIVSDDVDLEESAPEGLSGGQVGAISESKDVLILFVSQGVDVEVEQSVGFLGGKAGFF